MVKVVRIDRDGIVKDKRVDVGEIVTDGKNFYKVVEDDGKLKAIEYEMTLSKLVEILGVKKNKYSEILKEYGDIKVVVGSVIIVGEVVEDNVVKDVILEVIKHKKHIDIELKERVKKYIVYVR